MTKEEITKVYESAKKIAMNEITSALSGTKADLRNIFPSASGLIIGIDFIGGYIEIVYKAKTDLGDETFFVNVESKTAELTQEDRYQQFFCDFGAFMANKNLIVQIKTIMRTWHAFYRALHEMK